MLKSKTIRAYFFIAFPPSSLFMRSYLIKGQKDVVESSGNVQPAGGIMKKMYPCFRWSKLHANL